MHELDATLGDSIPDVMTIQDRRPPPIIPDFVVNIFTVAMVLLVSVVLVVVGVSFGQDVERAIRGATKGFYNQNFRPKGNHVMSVTAMNG